MTAPPEPPLLHRELPTRRVEPHRADDVATGAVLLRQVELANGFTDLIVPRSPAGGTYGAVQVLVRLHRRPLGLAIVPLDGRRVVDASLLAGVVVEELHDEINAHLAADGLPPVDRLPDPRIVPTLEAPCRHERTLARHADVLVSVVVTTCNRPSFLRRCVQSILRSSYPRLEVVVVENRPEGSTVAAAVADAFPGDERIRYVEEPRRGLSRARNRGIDHARGEITVFTDDDVLVDRHWLAHIVEAFTTSAAACVTGLILPVELETPAQHWLEEYGGFAKGFVGRTHDAASGRSDPLYPYAAGRFGSGANTALLTSVARDLHGFDTNLSAGTLAAGGEDLDLYIRLLRGGRRLTYQPSAIVWHRHHRELSTLTRQLFHYGTGLSAALTKQLLAVPGRGDLVRRVPRGVNYLLHSESSKNDRKSSGYPRVLTYAELFGFAFGPTAYLWTAASHRG